MSMMVAAVLSLPGDVLGDLRVGEQLLEVVIVPAQFLFTGHQVVDRAMTLFTDLDPGAHFGGRVPLLEPLVAADGARDEVVEIERFVAAA
jgi:hypothetical protein